jgi:hypothetical protein
MKSCPAFLVTLVSMLGPMSSLNGQARTSAAAERDYASAMKADLRHLATAEEAYFSDNNGYYAGIVAASQPLYGFSPSANVTLTVSTVDGGHQWIAKATHALTSTTCSYQLPGPAVCDPPPDTSMFATPRGADSKPVSSNETSGPKTTTIGNRDPVRIRATRSQSWPFDVRPPRTRCVVSGQIVALSGGDKKVVVMVMTEFAYQDWMKNRPARTYFESAPRIEIPFDVRIEEEGRYRLVVWNQSRAPTSKIVQLQQTKVDCAD